MQKQANFGRPDDKVAKHCGRCKLDGMQNIISKKCIVCMQKVPAFGRPDDKVAKHCGRCKLDGMQNIKHPKCFVCMKTCPVFAMPGEKVAKHCANCKLDGMVDIKNPKCIVCAIIQPNFAMPGEKVAKHCANCKLDSMRDIKSPKCIVCAIKRPYFGKPDDKVAKHCVNCKLDGMLNIINKRCKSDFCDTFATTKYEGYCLFCFMHLFPEKSTARNYKTREHSVLHFIRESFSNIDIITDKKVQGGCSRRRPDIFIDLGYQVIIVEVDENQHSNYDFSCENKRIMELSQDVGHRPIVFIRFNPDQYKLNNKNVPSCWSVNKNGICCVKQSKKNEWNDRLKCLRETLEYWMNADNRTNKIIESIYLFHDL